MIQKLKGVRSINGLQCGPSNLEMEHPNMIQIAKQYMGCNMGCTI